MSTPKARYEPVARYAGDAQVGAAIETITRTPTEVTLFRYCSVSCNSHRIHYDRGYAAQEGYPNVLVQSHLHGAYMTSLCTSFMGAHGRLVEVTYSVRRFAVPGDELSLGGVIVGVEAVEGGALVTLELQEERKSDQAVCAVGTGKVFLPDARESEAAR